MKRYVTLIVLFAPFATAYTIHVPSDYSLIHYAIGAAQDGDTVLVAPGSYVGGFSFQGKNIVVRSSAGAGSTFLKSPFDDYHCVMMVDGEDSTAVLEGFSITNIEFEDGPSDGRDPPDYGGGLYIVDSSPTIKNNVIYGCIASVGGGLYIQNSSTLVSNCTISNCDAWSHGGGIFIDDSDEGVPPRIIGCNISDNTAQYGGGLRLWGDTAIVINNTISGNDASGISVSSTNALICGNLIIGNSASGIRINSGKSTIIGNMIVENTAGHGGGISEYSGAHIVIENNTISNNTASVRGGGIHTKNDSITIVNNIVWDNSAPLGSQLYLLAFADPTQAYVDYSNIMYGEDSVYIDTYASLNWGPGNIDADPLFESGPICDYHLSMSSPCIDASNPSVEYNDPEDPFNPGYALWPAMGYLRNDMGAFGGGGVGYWLSVEEEEQASPPEEDSSLICYPNPSLGSVSIMMPLAFIANTDILVYDITGKLVRRFTDLETNVIQWDCDDESGREVPSGVYLIQGISGKQSLSVRFVKI